MFRFPDCVALCRAVSALSSLRDTKLILNVLGTPATFSPIVDASQYEDDCKSCAFLTYEKLRDLPVFQITSQKQLVNALKRCKAPNVPVTFDVKETKLEIEFLYTENGKETIKRTAWIDILVLESEKLPEHALKYMDETVSCIVKLPFTDMLIDHFAVWNEFQAKTVSVSVMENSRIKFSVTSPTIGHSSLTLVLDNDGTCSEQKIEMRVNEMYHVLKSMKENSNMKKETMEMAICETGFVYVSNESKTNRFVLRKSHL